MSSAPRTVYTTHQQGHTPEREMDVLASIYKLAINRYLEMKAAEESGGEHARKESKYASSNRIIQR